jgi:hypothetical protein
MPSLTGLTVAPATIQRGGSAAVTPTISNPDRVSTITGVDESGARVTASYDVHVNLVLEVVPAAQLPATAPAGTMVFCTDSTTDTLTVDSTNPLTLDLQTA